MLSDSEQQIALLNQQVILLSQLLSLQQSVVILLLEISDQKVKLDCKEAIVSQLEVTSETLKTIPEFCKLVSKRG